MWITHTCAHTQKERVKQKERDRDEHLEGPLPRNEQDAKCQVKMN